MKKSPPVFFKRFSVLPFLLALTLAGFAADDSKTVALSETSPAVRKTISAQIGDGTLGGIEEANENGHATFDVTYTTKAGKAHGFTVADGGALLSVEIALAETPAPVQKTIQAQAGAWEVESIDKSAGDAKPTFDVQITKDGEEKSFTVADDGTLVSAEVVLPETPPAVQKTIQTQAVGWEVKSIDKATDEAGTTFDVEIAKADQKKRFTVADDGKLLSTGVALSETPAPVQKTIQAQAAGWEVESIDKTIDETGTTFDVEVTKGALKKSFTVTDDGYFQSMEVALTDTPVPVQTAIQKQLAGGTVKSIEENFEPAGNSYDVVNVGKDGQRGSFSVGADGGLLSLEITLDQVVPVAKATIQKQIGDGTLKSIDESFDPPVNTYDVVAVMKDGSVKSFTVGEGGHVRSEEVTIDQAPAPAQKTIREQIGDGKIIRIDKAYAEKKEDGVVPFEVQSRKDGKPYNFSVGPKGKFLGADD
jgi:hypothetical protein